jgi:hypothetical protein
MNRFRRLAAVSARVVFLLIGVIALVGSAKAGGLLIQGRIISPNGSPLPGCLVSIASPSVAHSGAMRSRGVLTEDDGAFAVPFFADPNGQTAPPYLEIYWNAQLIFRQPLNSLPLARNAIYENKHPSTAGWDLEKYLTYGGEITLEPIRVGLP